MIVLQNEAYYTPLRDTLKYHKVDGLDLDIEENVDGSCPLALLRRLNSDFGNSFILTMAPVASELGPQEYGLGGFSYRDLDAAATAPLKPNGKLVNWYNAQFYNGKHRDTIRFIEQSQSTDFSSRMGRREHSHRLQRNHHQRLLPLPRRPRRSRQPQRRRQRLVQSRNLQKHHQHPKSQLQELRRRRRLGVLGCRWKRRLLQPLAMGKGHRFCDFRTEQRWTELAGCTDT